MSATRLTTSTSTRSGSSAFAATSRHVPGPLTSPPREGALAGLISNARRPCGRNSAPAPFLAPSPAPCSSLKRFTLASHAVVAWPSASKRGDRRGREMHRCLARRHERRRGDGRRAWVGRGCSYPRSACRGCTRTCLACPYCRRGSASWTQSS